MSELQVTVKQTPGIITWNFEELKHELAEQMKSYKAVVYTDENIGDAKSNIAALRKLRKAVDSRRVEIKNKCLEPYAVIEEQARELIGLIDEPIALIDKKVKDYDTRRRAAKKEKIMKHMASVFADFPEDIRKRLECKTYDSRWENATASDKMYKDAIKAAHDNTADALRILKNIDEDFREIVMNVYKVDLNMTAAMMKAQEMQRQKELVIERERKRREQEQKAKELEQQSQATETGINGTREKEIVSSDLMKSTTPKMDTAETPTTERREAEKPIPQIYDIKIIVRGTEEQQRKALAYIEYIGAEYRFMR